MTDTRQSPRRAELLELSYQYVLTHGIVGLSLRPLAAEIGSSPRVLLYLFGSKDGLVAALLQRARCDEIALLGALRPNGPAGLEEVAAEVWRWLADVAHRPLLALWVEAYARSLIEPDGAWASFAQATVEDWLSVLASAQHPKQRSTERGAATRTLILAVLRGALLDLLATGDLDRVNAAVHQQLASRRDNNGHRGRS